MGCRASDVVMWTIEVDEKRDWGKKEQHGDMGLQEGKAKKRGNRERPSVPLPRTGRVWRPLARQALPRATVQPIAGHQLQPYSARANCAPTAPRTKSSLTPIIGPDERDHTNNTHPRRIQVPGHSSVLLS